MMPIAVFEAITTDATLNGLGITAATVFEMQSLDGDQRPGVKGHFLVIRPRRLLRQRKQLLPQSYQALF